MTFVCLLSLRTNAGSGSLRSFSHVSHMSHVSTHAGSRACLLDIAVLYLFLYDTCICLLVSFCVHLLVLLLLACLFTLYLCCVYLLCHMILIYVFLMRSLSVILYDNCIYTCCVQHVTLFIPSCLLLTLVVIFCALELSMTLLYFLMSLT